MIVIKILAFILLLGIIVMIHECGHFIFAKLFNVHVHEFSIGMGPKLWQKQGKKETKYSLRLFPIGGYVSMAGESVNSNNELDKNVPEERKYYTQKYWKKVIILAAGVTMNFLLAISIFSILSLRAGAYAEAIPAKIVGITENFPAEQAGLEVGDEIIKMRNSDGSASMNIHEFYDAQVFTYANKDKECIVTVKRDGKILEFTMTPLYDEETQLYYIGIQGASENIKEVKWYNCIYYGFRSFLDSFRQTFIGFKVLFMPNGIKAMTGPVGIAQVTGQAVSAGIWAYIYLIALISVNIGIVNLLPLPILDGGQIVIETFEQLFRFKINDKVRYAINGACWIILMLLFVYICYNDVLKIVIG